MRPFVLVVLFLCVPAAFARSEARGAYTNTHYLYSIEYPKSWTVKEHGKSAMIVSPLAGPGDDFAENVVVVAEDLRKVGKPVPLIDYYRAAVQGAVGRLPDFKLLEEAQTLWNEHQTVANIYSMSERGKRFKCKTYTFMAGTTAYVLTYTARADDFETALGDAEGIMRSIRVSP